MDITNICQGKEFYPRFVPKSGGMSTQREVFTLVNLGVLDTRLLALFCSVRCPGDLILKTYDLARSLRAPGMTVISGVHSPMEKECLNLLLHGDQPIIVCPGTTVTVSVALSAPVGALAAAVEDSPPSGWTVFRRCDRSKSLS